MNINYYFKAASSYITGYQLQTVKLLTGLVQDILLPQVNTIFGALLPWIPKC
jgi:hypothetical protein